MIKMFYSDTCPNCPPVKNYLTSLNLDVTMYNASTTEGLDEARKYNIMQVPTVLFINDNETLIDQSVLQIKKIMEK